MPQKHLQLKQLRPTCAVCSRVIPAESIL